MQYKYNCHLKNQISVAFYTVGVRVLSPWNTAPKVPIWLGGTDWEFEEVLTEYCLFCGLYRKIQGPRSLKYRSSLRDLYAKTKGLVFFCTGTK